MICSVGKQVWQKENRNGGVFSDIAEAVKLNRQRR